MGRKKKSQSLRTPSSAPCSQSDETPSVPPQDLLELRLLRPPSSSTGTPSRSSIHQDREPLVFLTVSDANKLDVVNNDQIFLLAQKGTNDGAAIVAATAICKVRINTSKSKVGSPSKTKTSSLTNGHCRVTPIALANRLFFVDTPLAEAATPTAAPISTPKTPSSSKSSFSFAKGGGGDAMVSSPLSPVSTPAKHQSAPKQFLWVVPLDSNLGDKLTALLCREAARVCARPRHAGNEISDASWSNSKMILTRLLVASSSGNWYCKGDAISTSFKGSPMDWEIQSIQDGTTLSNDSSELEELLASMSLDTNDETSQVLDAMRSSMRLQDGEGLSLYIINYNTEFHLLRDSKDLRKQDMVDSGFATDTQPTTGGVIVAGLDDQLKHIKSLLLPPLLRPETFTKGSLRPPRGVLLHGPSGVGKSLLAQQVAMDLKSQSGVHVTVVNCTSLQSHTAIVGEAERRLTQLFRSLDKKTQLENGKGALLVFDDIHLICPKRGGGGSSEGSDRLSATLLALLDGIGAIEKDKKQPLVVLGITTNPSCLDPALRRPGRLDAEVEVPIPDEVTRAAILKFQLQQISQEVEIPPLSDADFMSLSRLAKGFNGADCMLAIKEAIRIALLRSHSVASDDVIQLTLQELQASIRSTKPSTIKSITVEIPQVKWTSIGGMDSVKEKLREAIELPMTHAHLFQALNIPPPRGVLLYGPPGCSKTLMARALATEGQMNFLAVKGPELLSKWLGESERALASLFRRARMASPCIIFFDEIDAIASKRGSSGGHSGGERLLSQLLTELDGINSPGTSSAPKDGSKSNENLNNKRVIVVGATNRPDLLDSALMRPGRIDRMIYVGVPDCKSRARILEIGLKGKACCDDIDISSLASDDITGGFSGAELIAICREAALFAIEEDDENMLSSNGVGSSNPQINMKHLVRAAQGMHRQITPKMIEFYASFRNKTIAS